MDNPHDNDTALPESSWPGEREPGLFDAQDDPPEPSFLQIFRKALLCSPEANGCRNLIASELPLPGEPSQIHTASV